MSCIHNIHPNLSPPPPSSHALSPRLIHSFLSFCLPVRHSHCPPKGGCPIPRQYHSHSLPPSPKGQEGSSSLQSSSARGVRQLCMVRTTTVVRVTIATSDRGQVCRPTGFPPLTPPPPTTPRGGCPSTRCRSRSPGSSSVIRSPGEQKKGRDR